MNTAFLSFDRVATFGFASVKDNNQAGNDALVDHRKLLVKLSAFCTRVLLLGGRSPLDQPMLSRILLASYAGGALASVVDEVDLDAETHGELAIRLLREVLQMTAAEAEQHAALLMSSAASTNHRLREIMQRGARAFAEWQAAPTEFVPIDFRNLVIASAAH